MALLKTFNEAAEEVGCTARALRRAVILGDLNVVRMGKSSRSDLIHPDDLDTFIEQLRQRGQKSCEEQKIQSKPEEIVSTLISHSKASQLDRLLGIRSGKKS